MASVYLLNLLMRCAQAEAKGEIPDEACPGLEPPPGRLPLEPHPSSLWAAALSIFIVCSVMVGVAMAVRIFTKAYIVGVFFTVENLLMIFATAALAAIVGTQIKVYQYGVSRHQWNVTVGQLFKILLYVYAIQILYCLAIYAAKLSILLQIKKLFEGTRVKKSFVFWASWVCIVLLTAAYTATLILLIYPCSPTQKAWEPFVPGSCHDASAGFVSGGVNLISDVAILVLPVIGVSQLRMSARKKLAVSAVFATGLVTCIVSAIRINYSVHERRSDDKTYWLSIVGLCATVEITMVILCGCFTTFPRFFKWVRGDKANKTFQSRSFGTERRSNAPQQMGNIIEVRKDISVTEGPI